MMRPRLPLRVVRTMGSAGDQVSVRVEDAGGRAIYLYCEDNDLRRDLCKAWTSREATELAQIIARFLTDESRVQEIEEAVRRFAGDDWFKPSGHDG